MNIYTKYYLIAFNGIAIMGAISVHLLTELWNIVDADYNTSFILMLIHSVFVLLPNLKTRGICKNPYNYQIGRSYFGLLFLFWIISILCVYIMVIFAIAIPLSQLFNLFVIVFPAVCMLVQRNSLGIFTLFILLIAHSISANRVYVASAVILFFISVSVNRKIPIIIPVLCLIVLMISLSILKIENEIIDLNFSELSIDFASKLGSEWRDGILLHSEFSNDQKISGRFSYVQSFLTIVPLHGAFGIISYEDYYYNLMSTHLLEITGLGAQGYTGIRIGLIWEIYVLFGLIGVTLYSLLVGFLLRMVWRYASNCDGFIIFTLLFIGLMYAQIGMINFVLGIYISGIICIVFTLLFLRVIITNKNVK